MSLINLFRYALLFTPTDEGKEQVQPFISVENIQFSIATVSFNLSASGIC